MNTTRDTSYGALNSTSISAFNMQLLKTPVAADIFTEEFMRDVATTTVEDLLNGYGAGAGQVFPTPDTNSNDNQAGDRVGIGPIGSRGVTGSSTRRNGFVASATNANFTDTFDMERVEMIKGANALLFGASGAGGIVNTSSKLARFGSDRRPFTTATLTSRIDQYGSKRWQLDANYGRNYGLYGANYMRWFDDRFTTLFGFRYSKSFTRVPNTSATGTQAWTDTDWQSNNYNLGLTYRVKSWLYAYYNAGRTFTPPTRPGDFYGNPPKDIIGFSHEIGFKYEPADARISGSISYYTANSRNESFNNYSSYANVVNPVGLNDAFNPALRNVWVNLDKESSGLEIILTATPTRNWRSRLGFTQQDGKIRTTAAYPILWNDEFFYNKATGGVTYADGTPFLVPTDAAGVAAVNSSTTLRAPVVGATNTQLTIAMMSDRTNPYYAYGQGGTTETNGRITNNSTVYRALRYFQIPAWNQNLQARTLRTGLPVSEIPYVYNDPAGLKGVVVLATAGEPTVGHPLYRFVFTNTYDFRAGWLRGATLGGTVRWDLDKRTYWYTEPNGSGGTIRKLYQEVSINPQVSPFIAYTRKIGRGVYRAQMNVNNLFNKYKVELRPNGTTGYTVEDAIFATFVGEPRQYVWTNTISF